MNTINVLMLGDIVGITGRALLARHLDQIKQQYAIDLTIVNGENSARGGRGITPRVIDEFKAAGVDCITGGNHSFQRKEVYEALNTAKNVLRPLNFPSGCPGTGIAFVSIDACDSPVAVVSLQGRVFMRDHLLCPFKTLETALTFVASKTPLIIVDFHAEATSEKMGVGLYFDGKISALLGTHSHVQTADERILPFGTAFITDVGMVGSLNGMLGMSKEPVLNALITQMPNKFSVDKNPPYIVNGVVLKLDTTSGKALGIERVQVYDDQVVCTDEKLFVD